MLIPEIDSLEELMRVFPTEERCIAHLEKIRWGDKVVSPFDKSSKVYKCKGHKYRCRNTGKYFNVKTQTLFDNSKLPLRKWFIAIYLITGNKKGISSLQLSRNLKITQKSAWFVLHRIRNCYNLECKGCLQNEVEADETYIGGKSRNKHASKRVKGTQGRSMKEKAAVFGMLQRKGLLVAKVVKNTKSSVLLPEITKAVKKESIIYTDECKSYNNLKRIYNHEYVKHNKGEYVKGRVHTNTIEGFWALLKRSIYGIYHSVSHKHLQKYVDESIFRYNHRKTSISIMMFIFLSKMTTKLTYKELINE